MRIAMSSIANIANKPPRGREECVEFTKLLGRWIENNADTLVGDIHNVRGIIMRFNLEVDEIPILEVLKRYNLDIDTNLKEEVKN